MLVLGKSRNIFPLLPLFHVFLCNISLSLSLSYHLSVCRHLIISYRTLKKFEGLQRFFTKCQKFFFFFFAKCQKHVISKSANMFAHLDFFLSFCMSVSPCVLFYFSLLYDLLLRASYVITFLPCCIFIVIRYQCI